MQEVRGRIDSLEASALPPENKQLAFQMHRLALVAATDCLADSASRLSLREAIRARGPQFLDFIIYHKLGSLWHYYLDERASSCWLPPHAIARLRLRRFAESASYAAQNSCLQEIDNLFVTRRIVYAVIKGAHTREVVYPDPALRPANDIDVLVRPSQRQAAVRALVQVGFEFHPDPENISHEATLTKGSIAIDLHWDILRPGRTRVAMAERLLARRTRIRDFFCLHDTDAVFLMLVHPAFTRYVCSPTMGLTSVVDFLWWLKTRPVDWEAVLGRLEKTGLKAAAWTQIMWFTMLVDKEALPIPRVFMNAIQPGAARSSYLEQWLRHDLPSRWISRPVLIQSGLTLALHDRPSDAAHALLGWWRSRQMRGADPLLSFAGQ